MTDSGYKKSNKLSSRTLVSLSVYNVGAQKCPPDYQWGPGVRDHYLIHYVVSGKGTYRAGSQRWEVSAGDVFLVLPGTQISYRADHFDPWEYQWVGFAGSDAAAMVDSMDFSPEKPVLTGVPFGDELLERLRRIENAFGNSFRDSVTMTGHLYLALSLFMHRTAAEGIPVNIERANVRNAVSYIDSHYSFDLSIDEVAAFIGVSRSTLYRQFMHSLGLSPKQYLEDFRMQRACLLLTETDLPVSAIATSVGIDNPLYFSRSFHARIGMAPTQYRALNSSSAKTADESADVP